MATSIEPAPDADGILTVKVSGQLTASQWQGAQQAALVQMRQTLEKVAVLIIVEHFLGWDRGGWGESPFQSEFDGYVRRMAIVGEVKCEDLALLFTAKGLRRFPIEYFPSSGVESARRWLNLDNHVEGTSPWSDRDHPFKLNL